MLHRCFRRYDTASLAAFTGRALMIFRAGFAVNIAGSFVNGLMPFRAFVADFLMTTNLANPGTKKAPVFSLRNAPKGGGMRLSLDARNGYFVPICLVCQPIEFTSALAIADIAESCCG